MPLQNLQNPYNIDSLSHTGVQNQTELGLLVIILFVVLVFLVWLVSRRRPTRTHSKDRGTYTTSKSTRSSSTFTKPTSSPKTTNTNVTQKSDELHAEEKLPSGDGIAEKSKTESLQRDYNRPEVPTVVQPEQEEQSRPKYIGYKPINIFKQTEPYDYPIVLMPKPKCVIKFPRKGRTGREGFTEEDFKSHLKRYFSDDFKIYDDRFIKVKGSTSPYEPDFSMIDEREGLNAFIDIEIDEPYEGINDIPAREAKHYQKADTNRNNAFIKRGWIVIRFAEIQIHKKPIKCCLFIADVIKAINPDYEIPSSLLKVSPVSKVKQWTKEQAEKWSLEKYRERYLGIEGFGHIPETEILHEVEETELGELIEEQIEDESTIYPEEVQSQEPNNLRSILQECIASSHYLAFTYSNNKTIIKPEQLNLDSIIGYCYVKNSKQEILISEIQDPVIKPSPFIIEESSPDLGLDTVRNIINTAIQYGKYIRMTYTRASWTDINVDKETGEITEHHTDAETKVRTISNVDFAVNTLAEEHIEQYNLRNEDFEYISAYCHLRGAERVFRFDRISELAILDI